MFKRFRDAASGLFVKPSFAKINKSTTVGVPNDQPLSRRHRAILEAALEDEILQPSAFNANGVLRRAIKQVLGQETKG